MFATNGAYVYNALLATVRKQFSKGLSLQVSYTWSKGLVTQNYGINTAPYEVLQLAPSPVYHPQRVVINYVWNLPAHLNGWKGRVLNDWTWAGVTTIQNGVPFSVYDSNAGSRLFPGRRTQCGYHWACSALSGRGSLNTGPIEQRLGGSLSANGYLNPAAFAVLRRDLCATDAGERPGPTEPRLRLRQHWRRHISCRQGNTTGICLSPN